MIPEPSLQAVVFGASGITGYAILKELLHQQAPTNFSRVIGLTNRPFERSSSLLPDDDRLEVYSGLDLMSSNKTLSHMKGIAGIEETTHVYFTAYSGHGSDYEELKRVNSEILTNAIESCEQCCPKMEFVTLQTGGKAYGPEFVDEGVPYHPPLQESMPRVPEPWASKIFYYAQVDILTRMSAGKAWTFCEVRPDAVVGFVPNNNAMNIAQATGLFLSLFRDIHGEAAEVPFPGSRLAWKALHSDTSQDILARFHIFASLHPDVTAERAFNITDGDVTNWATVWPEICSYFGLRGISPSSDTGFSVARWIEDHQVSCEAFVDKHDLKRDSFRATGFDFLDMIISIPFRRDYDSSASRRAGFMEARPHIDGYKLVFDQMRKARILV